MHCCADSASYTFSEIDIWFPVVDQLEVPTTWWDSEADKSLLIGVFKHGRCLLLVCSFPVREFCLQMEYFAKYSRPIIMFEW